MRKSILAITLASTAALGACASNPQVAQDAAIGAAGGAAIGAVVPGVSVLQGAAVGAAIGGVSGALIGRVAEQPGQCYYRDRYGRRYIDDCR